MKELRQNSEKILKKSKTIIKKIIHNKIFIIIFSVILFFITDLLLIYPSINNYIKNKIYQDVEQQRNSLNDEIDKLMEYGDITTGEFFGRYSPDLTKDVKRHNVLQQFMSSDHEDLRNKAYGLSSWINLYPNLFDEMESLHLIFFGGTWKINRLSRDEWSSKTFIVECVEPIALGYKKCNSYEKKYRPHPYAASKEAFDYLTSKDNNFSVSYTNKRNIIESILNEKNKYFYINHRATNNDVTGYGYVNAISDYYCAIIYGIKFDYYEIQCDNDLIESEISHNTKIIFSITTISLITLFSLIIYLILKVRKNT